MNRDSIYLCMRKPATDTFRCTKFETVKQADEFCRATCDNTMYTTLVPFSRWYPSILTKYILKEKLTSQVTVDIYERK